MRLGWAVQPAYLNPMPAHGDRDLPEIPVVDLGAGFALALLAAEGARAEALLDLASARYPAFAVGLGDRFSRRWLEKHANPYLDEVHAVATPWSSA